AASLAPHILQARVPVRLQHEIAGAWVLFQPSGNHQHEKPHSAQREFYTGVATFGICSLVARLVTRGEESLDGMVHLMKCRRKKSECRVQICRFHILGAEFWILRELWITP